MEEHRRNQASPIDMDHPSSDHTRFKGEAHRSPLRLLIITIVAIFMAEVVAMIVVYFLEPSPYAQVTLVDAGIMTILIFPVLYFFSFRPLIRQMEKSWKEIAERKEIERNLRIRTTAMETAANGIVITDRLGNIQWINPAFVQISGYAADELMGQNMKLFRSGRHETAFYEQMWDTILSGQVWQGEIVNRQKDGRLYIEAQTITPVRGEQGEITQFIAIKQDITERKQAEKDISERDQKEKILTQTIQTMQLDIARDLHDTVGQNISFLRMKLDYLAEKKLRKRAEIQSELQSMARVANESYDLMRGTLAVLQSADSTDLFRLFTRYAEQIEERSTFKIELCTQGEPRFMSARRMRQLFYIFREILSNIEKHSNASRIVIDMTWEQDCLNLVVCDNGSGFDMEKVPYGSHYGLKFMRERAELLNGFFSIRSATGAGTSIQLQVPYE